MNSAVTLDEKIKSLAGGSWKVPLSNAEKVELCQRLRAAEAKATRPAPCEHACEAQAFKIEIRQLAGERDRLQVTAGEMAAEIDRMNAEREQLLAQPPFGYACGEWFFSEKSEFENHAAAYLVGSKPEVKTAVTVYAQAVPSQRSADRQTIIDILFASGNLSEGITADLIIGAVGAQPSPAVAVPDCKEQLFQLRQQSENWSTKLGFITSAINSRKISLSDKEREFPHLLIERLHTDSELLKQRETSPRITEQDIRETLKAYGVSNLSSGSFVECVEGRALLAKLNGANNEKSN